MGFGVAARALKAEEVVAAGNEFAVGGFQCPLGGNKFGEFGASDAGGFKDAFPGVGEVGLFAGHAPGLEPALVATKNVGVGLVDELFQFGDGRHLVREGLVVPEQIA